MERAAIFIATASFAFILLRLQGVWRKPAYLDGHKRITLTGSSNMIDETHPKYTKPPGAQATHERQTWKAKALYFHPIKSCAGVEVDVADIDAAGFTWDRKFAFAELIKPQTRPCEPEKAPSWVFRTMRQPGWERLALVRPEIWLPDPAASVKGNHHGWMLVKYPYLPPRSVAFLFRFLVRIGLLPHERSFRVPLKPPQDHQYSSETVKIWKDDPEWLNYGVHLPKDFGSFVGCSNPIMLFRVDSNTYREVYRCAPREEQLGFQPVVGFADAYPVHLLNIASVRDIAGRVKNDIPQFSAKRFRSNILLEGPCAYDEDDWKKIRVGSHIFYCACRTVRCRLPNVDPDTAVRHPVEPDKTLKSFRCIDEGDALNACLGLQLVPAEKGPFRIHAGDEVEVLERGYHKYIKQ